MLVASGTQDGMTLIGSVLGTSSEAARDANALALLKYGFAEFTLVHPVRAGQVIARRPSAAYPVAMPSSSPAAASCASIPRADRVRSAGRAPARLVGPLARGDGGRTGDRCWSTRGRCDTVPLVLGRALPAPPPAVVGGDASAVRRCRACSVDPRSGSGLQRAPAVRLTEAPSDGLEAG